MGRWLCVARTQADGDSQPLPPERRASVAGSLVAAEPGASASAGDSAAALVRGGGCGLSWSVQPAPHTRPVASGRSAGWTGAVRSRSLTHVPPCSWQGGPAQTWDLRSHFFM